MAQPHRKAINDYRWFITHNGAGGAAADTFAQALRYYAKALQFAGKDYAYRGTQNGPR